MKNSVLKVGMIASLVMAMAIPAIVPNVIFAQADVGWKIGGRIGNRIAKRIGGKTVRPIASKIDRLTGSRIARWSVNRTGRWIVRPIGSKIAKRIVVPIAAGAGGKFVPSTTSGAHDRCREPRCFCLKPLRDYWCRLPWRSCFSRAMFRDARS